MISFFQEELLREEGLHDLREDGALPALGPPPEESQEGRGGRRALPLLRPGTDLLLVQTKIDLQIVAGYTLLYVV